MLLRSLLYAVRYRLLFFCCAAVKKGRLSRGVEIVDNNRRRRCRLAWFVIVAVCIVVRGSWGVFVGRGGVCGGGYGGGGVGGGLEGFGGGGDAVGWEWRMAR